MSSELPLLTFEAPPSNLLVGVEGRSSTLWIRDLPTEASDIEDLIEFLRLPWRMVVSEVGEEAFVGAIDAVANVNDDLARKRGFIQVIGSDPSRLELPQRCLPVYLLNGRSTQVASAFDSQLRKLTMLESVRRSGTREIVVLSWGDPDPTPSGLHDLWTSGFRAYLSFVSGSAGAEERLRNWLGKFSGGPTAHLIRVDPRRFVEALLGSYRAIYPEHRRTVRIRDRQGQFWNVDLTEADEPERPILDTYQLIEERDLHPLVPEELSQEEFVDFFRATGESWRPFAAGLPWIRDTACQDELRDFLQRLDAEGPEENLVAYILSEPGAGGTTLARALAWRCATDGYPVLVAKPLPFVPDALPLVNFLTRAAAAAERRRSLGRAAEVGADNTERAGLPTSEPSGARYETPWVIVFDRIHWEGRDGELQRFHNELAKSGRPVVLLVVSGPVRGLAFFNQRVFHKVAELNHAISKDAADSLGSHLNRFLRVFGRERPQWQWDRFHADHTTRYLEGQATFWVSLSFWIQGQYDLNESIQAYLYRNFRTYVTDSALKKAVLEIAALSSERMPMPEGMLPDATGRWPVVQLLDDLRGDLASLGLVRISDESQSYWALIHDILGRFLINAVFYDFAERKSLGWEGAQDAEHLRFMILRQISAKPILGESLFRPIGEDFATTIFKVDPDHGHANFTDFWRDVLTALDSMSGPLRDSSRVFRHHTAVSRRRIAKLNERIYGVTDNDRNQLLVRAIDDIQYALHYIDYTAGSESNLNLFNSLANAYFDLADLESKTGAPDERIDELRRLASDSTRRAYEESPTNSFVIETFVKNLLQNAKYSPGNAIANCVEALGLLYSALASNETTYRAARLGDLADQALSILFESSPSAELSSEPHGPVEVLLNAWKLLARSSDGGFSDLSLIPAENMVRALDALSHPAGTGNMQVLRMQYDLASSVRPHAFKEQLGFLEQLAATDYRMTPQLRLEYAILLFQNGRAAEGDKAFRQLRQLWRETEHFVQVPSRMRWLLGPDGESVETVQAFVGSDYGTRAMARVPKFRNILVPFRPEEHGFRELRPSTPFACHVSFGHNGPFLRPVTAGPTRGG